MRRVPDEGPMYFSATAAPKLLSAVLALPVEGYSPSGHYLPYGADCTGPSLAFVRLCRTKDCAEDDND